MISRHINFLFASILTFICLAASAPATQASMPGLLPSSQIAGCPLFPQDNIWNTRVDTLPVDPHSGAYIASIGADTGLHPDFGAGEWDGHPIGIPYNIVPGSQPRLPVSFTWPGESDPGPYPIPPNPAIEGGSDSHILLVDRDNCVLYELYAAYKTGGSWHAGSGAIFNLRSNTLRPAGWTSADAAGLPILAGLARYEEVASGAINHALRFTAHDTRGVYIWPARHEASDITDIGVPPHGPALPAEGRLRHLRIFARGADHSDRFEEIRPHPGRQRQQLVHQRRARRGLGG